MWFQDFQDGCHGGHLGYQNGIILAILISMLPRCLPSSFPSIQLTVREQILFEDLQDSGRRQLETYKIAGVRRIFRRLTILAILNLYVASMPPIMFWLKQTNGFGGDVVWRISRWPTCHPGYRNGTILAILSVCVTVMPPINFQLNRT